MRDSADGAATFSAASAFRQRSLERVEVAVRRHLKTRTEIGRLIAAEVRRLDHDVDEASLLLVRRSGQWMATLRSNGQRVDEACLAAVASAGQRLAGLYDVEEMA
jgi:hypothetical protein